MNKKYLLQTKRIFWQYYVYLIIAIILAYNAYICYFVYTNIGLVDQNDESVSKNQSAINTTLYEKIVEQKKAKQIPQNIETNTNPFNS